MGYQALLFCPDEKTARTVTQVLGELEFSVEACIEPFAAVKKLMGEHFDAVVVDCDNEQNATLLFKSARNSTSNQTSLAVAVVEGQVGVAKAFRIGANLVLTKPINIEQAKGTLRVARGLLRKGEPGKPGVPATPAASTATPAAVPAKSAPKAVVAPKPAPVAKEPAVAAPAPPPAAMHAPAWPVAAAASTTPAAHASDLFEKHAERSSTAPEFTNEPIVPKNDAAPVMTSSPAMKAASAPAFASSGAASAPAPAREPEAVKTEEAKPVEATPERAAESTAIVGSAPTFSFGGAASTSQSEGGGRKKIFIGVAAAVVIAVGGYFGWAHFKPSSSETATSPSPVTQSVPAISQAEKPSAAPSARPVNASVPAPLASTVPSSKDQVEDSERNSKESATHSTKETKSETSSAPEKSVEESPEPEPLVVKGGKVPTTHAKAAADAAAPSLIGMATPGEAPPTNLVPTATPEFKPVLQTMSVSQGVSRGLLYKKVAPVYPASALRMRIEGTVDLTATISKTGDITQVKQLSGDKQLGAAAITAVKQWKYKPYLLNGEPVEIQTQVTVNFKLPN
ncbi:MAG TPA: TonB family protein [Candidatus Sulfotelmatobacter sp.]|nr:TonB family protein [Candidatus Sulfotelmatobacter sp.]